MPDKNKLTNKIQANPSLTVFQKKVLTSTLDILRGEVRTYAQIAKGVGSPKAARAVGRALGKNPYAPSVPCHRVVSTDGTIGGYSGSGGIKQKRKLLEAEGAKIKKDK